MDSYQAIYDAVRSRIGSADAGNVIERAAREAFDISYVVQGVAQEFAIAAGEHQRPSVLFRPRLAQDGGMWCALYGENLHDGIAGFGATPDAAMRAFDLAWVAEQTPSAARSAPPTGEGS